MTSLSVERIVGAQRPRISHIPAYSSSTGDEAIELAEMAGLVLDEWQQWVLRHSLGETPDGRWAAREVGLMVSRQNGKGALLEARELAGLFLLEEDLIVHTAHLFDTAGSHFRRLTKRIEDTPELAGRLAKPGGILRGHGNESITLARSERTGRQPRLEVRTRTGAGGLGFSISCLVFDEAMIISEEMHQALLPTLSAMPNVQVWYTGSAVDQENPAHQGVPFARIREKGIKGSESLAYFEWSLDAEDPEKVGETGEEQWAQANPGLGIRITPGWIREVEAPPGLSHRGFAVQRLGVGDWPRTDGLDGVVITPEAWAACADPESRKTGAVCFSLDVARDRSYGAIGVSGFRADGKLHVEVVEHKRGTGWIVARIVELVKTHSPLAVILDASGAVSSLVPELIKALKEDEDGNLLLGLPDKELVLVNAREHAQACGMIYDAVDQDTLRHLGTTELTAAIAGAVKRPLGDSWAWSRKNSTIDICPLVAITLALWGSQTHLRAAEPKVIDLGDVYSKMLENGEEI
jgi:hypothetical protein